MKQSTRADARTKEKKSKETTKTRTKPAHSLKESLLYHALIDASVEHRPLQRPLQPGERHLDFSVQAQCTPLPHAQQVQISLGLRAVVLVQEGPMLIIEISYMGVTNVAEKQKNYEILPQILYPHAREALLKLADLVGHQPPLPATWADVQQIAQPIPPASH